VPAGDQLCYGRYRDTLDGDETMNHGSPRPPREGGPHDSDRKERLTKTRPIQRKDEAAILQLVHNMHDAQNTKDGELFASVFAQQHHYIAINGMFLPNQSRQDNARTHHRLGRGACAFSRNLSAIRGAASGCGSWIRTAASSSCSRNRKNGRWQGHEFRNGGQHAWQRLEGARNIRRMTHDPRPSRGSV
jgi:hypothetical protein